MKQLHFTLLLSLSLLTNCCLFANAINELNGTITDALTGQPIPNAVVSVPKKIYNIYSDSQGNYKLKLPPATYTFIISAMGYETKELSVKVVKNQQEIPK